MAGARFGAARTLLAASLLTTAFIGLSPNINAASSTFLMDGSDCDTFCTSGGNYVTNSVTYFPWAGTDRRTFLRWSVDIPAGATITSATIDVNADRDDSGTDNVYIERVDSANCPSFNSNPWSLPVAGSAVEWTVPPSTTDQWYSSEDIAALVQAFIDQPGYAEGNYFGVRVTQGSGYNGHRWINTHDAGAGAQLVVTYDMSSGGSGGSGIYQVAASADDTFCKSGANYLNHQYVYWPWASTDRRSFIRLAIDAPAGATISSATISVNAGQSYSGTSNAKLQLVDADDCADFSSNPFNRAVTSTEVEWTLPAMTAGQWYETDITALVQEFVNRPGYQPGNYMGIRTTEGSGYNSHRLINSFDSGAANAAKLDIVWGGGSGGSGGTLLNVELPASGKHYDSYADLEFVWPTNHGEGDVCLWGDDKLAAISITIDDNVAPTIPFWLSMGEQFNWKFTWFLIVHDHMWDVYLDAPGYNQSQFGSINDWIPVHNAGHDLQLHGRDSQLNHLNAADYLEQSLLSMAYLQDNLPKTITTYAFPNGSTGTNGEYKDVMSEYLISARGTSGGATPIHLADFMQTKSMGAVSGYNLDGTEANHATWFNRLEDNSRSFNYSQYRGWAVLLYHTVSGSFEANVEAALQRIKDDEHKYWVRPYTTVAQYAQSRLTSELTIDSVAADEIRFTLTDDMIDEYYFTPLTVKLRVNNDWTDVVAFQNGQNIPAKLIQHNGNDYVLVDAVPDRGQVTVMQTGMTFADRGEWEAYQLNLPNTAGLATMSLTYTTADLDPSDPLYNAQPGDTVTYGSAYASAEHVVGFDDGGLDLTDILVYVEDGAQVRFKNVLFKDGGNLATNNFGILNIFDDNNQGTKVVAEFCDFAGSGTGYGPGRLVWGPVTHPLSEHPGDFIADHCRVFGFSSDGIKVGSFELYYCFIDQPITTAETATDVALGGPWNTGDHVFDPSAHSRVWVAQRDNITTPPDTSIFASQTDWTYRNPHADHITAYHSREPKVIYGGYINAQTAVMPATGSTAGHGVNNSLFLDEGLENDTTADRAEFVGAEVTGTYFSRVGSIASFAINATNPYLNNLNRTKFWHCTFETSEPKRIIRDDDNILMESCYKPDGTVLTLGILQKSAPEVNTTTSEPTPWN